MAHKIRVYKVPHLNKDGSVSATKNDWIVRCKSRKVVHIFQVCPTKKKAEEMVENHRKAVFIAHRIKNPNDRAHQRKHGYKEGVVGVVASPESVDAENVA